MGDNATAGPSSVLPPGWTSHVSPAGRSYYHNASSGVSTYVFPTPKPPKREKPISKAAIPHTNGWFRITTNKGNVFYFHPESKASKWLPPPEVANALRQIEEEEAKENERLMQEREARSRAEREKERQERLERKRKAEEGVLITEFDASKRARADEESDEETEDEDKEEVASMSSDVEAPSDTKDPSVQANDMSLQQEDDEHDDDADWQLQMAEQMAAEAEAESETEADPKGNAQDRTKSLPHSEQPESAFISLEEQKTAFRALLTSLNGTKQEINPMAPWDLEQPKFSHQPAFLSLPSREREEVFNEWCKLRIREKRAAKAAIVATAPASAPASSSKSSRSDPFSPTAESNLLSLLKSEVRSTRTRFSDFKKVFSHDACFASYGRADADREKLFKRHLVELGEEKKRAAERAEREFLDLLSDLLPGNYRNKVAAAKADMGGKEREKEKVMEVWLEAKKTQGLVVDKRYDAVGSSTRRFELFGDWARGERRPPQHIPSRTSNETAPRKEEDAASIRAKEKAAARTKALREREETVRRERERLHRINRSAFSAATREESLLSFRQLLLDAVHSPHVSYHASLPQLARDSRFDSPALTDADREALFKEHQSTLAKKEGDKIGHVFARHAKSLDSHPEDVLAITLQDDDLSHPPLSIYKEDRGKLEAAYDNWEAQRRKEAESAFREMLSESAFVEFWGRLRKHASTVSVPSDAPKQESQQRSTGQEDDDEEGDATTLVEMARKVDLREIESVLRNDARFRAWKHRPELRERWIRDHLEQLAAPAKSVHR